MGKETDKLPEFDCEGLLTGAPNKESIREISEIKNEGTALKLLDFMGSFLYCGNRLERFIKESVISLSPTDKVDKKYLKTNSDKNSRLFGIIGENGDPIAGLIIKYYLWDKLGNQMYLHPTFDGKGEIKTLSCESISSIVARKLRPRRDIDLGIYLSLFTVKEEMRGLGVGKSLYKKFIEEARLNPEKCKLVFTITLGKYSKTHLGESIMKHVLGKNLREIDFLDLSKQLNLPRDLFEADFNSYPTRVLSKEFGFTFLGYGKYLGEVWGTILYS